MKHLLRIVPAAVAAFIVLQAAPEKKGSFDITFTGNAPEMSAVQAPEKKGSFDITAFARDLELPAVTD